MPEEKSGSEGLCEKQFFAGPASAVWAGSYFEPLELRLLSIVFLGLSLL